MEIGVYTFAETTADPATGIAMRAGEPPSAATHRGNRTRGSGRVDVFGVGEHHRPDFAASAPAIVLAAAASRTKRIKLTSAVTVLSSDDPVRVFQDFATLDLLSNGRAEIMAGRGSFIESFPLFGYDLDDYDELFAEKLDLLLKIRDNDRVTWSGRHRAAMKNLAVYPRPERPLPIWVAVGGTPQSVARAGSLGLLLAIAIIGGSPAQFVPFAELYRESARRAGHDPAPPLSINSHGWIAEDSQRAAEEIFPSFADTMNRIGRERGFLPTSTRARFEAERGLRGALLVGSPQQVIDKILWEREIFGLDRFLMQLTVGSMPHAKVMHAIELLGTKVAPAVRSAAGAA